MDHTVLAGAREVPSSQAEVNAPYRARVRGQLLCHEHAGELLARLPILPHLDPVGTARAAAVEAVVGGGAEASCLPRKTAQNDSEQRPMCLC